MGREENGMGVEIERKFKVIGDSWRGATKSVHIVQGYLSKDAERVVRIRLAGDRGALTVKGASVGSKRAEYEYEIPADDARELLDGICLRPLVEKTRHYVRQGSLLWTIDEFHAPQEGLLIAEIELPSPDSEFDRPQWLGEEVTGDPRYYNHNLGPKDPPSAPSLKDSDGDRLRR
jgi:adenylate cyclase